MNKPIIKVLTGQRRVGKSYLMRQIADELVAEHPDSNVIFVNKEDFQFDHIKNAADLIEFVTQKWSLNALNIVLVDEVQEIESFEKALRSLLLRERCDIYVTGSNAKFYSSEIATILAGRSIEIPVFSLSYPEFLRFHGLTESKTSFDLFLRFGGLPYLRHLELKDSVVGDYLKNILDSIVFRDVVARNNIRNSQFLQQLAHYLADTTGSLFSAKKISDYLKSQRLKIEPNQVIKYIQHLCDAYIIDAVKRFDIKGKQLFEVGEKYYFENLGLRNALSGFKPGDTSKLLENAVYNHLKYLGYETKVGKWNENEIDFVAEKSGERRYIQVTWRMDDESTLEREFGNLEVIKDNYPKTVISLSDDVPNTFRGIEYINARTFLMKEEW